MDFRKVVATVRQLSVEWAPYTWVLMKRICKILCFNTAVGQDTGVCKCPRVQWKTVESHWPLQSSVKLFSEALHATRCESCLSLGLYDSGAAGCVGSVMLLFITDVGWVEERPAVWHPDIICSAKRNDINKVSFATMGPGGLIKHL